MIRHTKHSLERCIYKYNLDPEVVLAAVNKVEDIIREYRTFEVKVILRRYKYRVYPTPGDSGDYLIAAIDPNRRTIKTVTLRRQEQLDGEVYPIVDGSML
jgi:hypothetical protein